MNLVMQDMAETDSSWPGERNPTRLDVLRANEVPDPSFLRDFKQAFLARDLPGRYRPAVSFNPAVQPMNPRNTTTVSHHDEISLDFTYPLELVSRLSDIPDLVQLTRLQSSFWTLSRGFAFLRAIPMPQVSRNLVPPHLQLSMACWVSCLSSTVGTQGTRSQQDTSRLHETARTLLIAALRVWGVMLEVDNRESRKLDSVMSSALLACCGTLITDRLLSKDINSQLGYTGAVVRRLHMHDYCTRIDGSTRRADNSSNTNDRLRSLLMAHLFLSDVLRAVHFNTSTQFSSSELFIIMPSSSHKFHDIYSQLILRENPLPHDMVQQEDALLILTALLSDIIAVHRTFAEFDLQDHEMSILSPEQFSGTLGVLDPFVPLSAFSESRRMIAQISKSLDIWAERFKTIMPEDVLVLYYFCNVCLSCPQILSLSHSSGYKLFEGLSRRPEKSELPEISTEAIRNAWLVVDHVNVDRLTDKVACPIWLPVVTYTTALVVWASLNAPSASTNSHGTKKVLAVFKTELEQMNWPCCTDMASNLNELMQT